LRGAVAGSVISRVPAAGVRHTVWCLPRFTSRTIPRDTQAPPPMATTSNQALVGQTLTGSAAIHASVTAAMSAAAGGNPFLAPGACAFPFLCPGADRRHLAAQAPVLTDDVACWTASGRAAGAMQMASNGTLQMPGNVTLQIPVVQAFPNADSTWSQVMPVGLTAAGNINLKRKATRELEAHAGVGILNQVVATQRRKESHNATEQKRRQRINEKMKELQLLLPGPDANADKATVLNAAIDHIKRLTAETEQLAAKKQDLERQNQVVTLCVAAHLPADG
jgi:hypothetical protein